jgi:N-acetylglutamate synthase-like GNAT family acetyltransferase
MNLQIRRASAEDEPYIRDVHQELNRPARGLYQCSDFLIAWIDGDLAGCAGTTVYQDGAYFYGLAVRKRWQRQGIGSRLMQARIDAVAGTSLSYAVALVMFWNSRFFRKFAFTPINRKMLPSSATFHADLTNPAFRRSAVMLRSLR